MERTVVALAGDGDFLMNGQELATATQFGCNILVIVVDNGAYGTIRMHQERELPGSVEGTDLKNPDFAELARAYVAWAERRPSNSSRRSSKRPSAREFACSTA